MIFALKKATSDGITTVEEKAKKSVRQIKINTE